ncbi:MAG: hypothetical protein A2849_02690 [Candidatus Taylorbacteria bacterium RIFCSPHIGHO2_01_FULL_51_15]|uniref:Xylose isomerase-like TIM barrel domain-containing protein n=1 Tax=Candidatus Taylorbacteria bacterium RIFCSPHIGHO2_01_FULL_51_15 TaxID=1802304 RepID=A0A1G2MD15_9BACT|nr:MAG: hypothetical protein A2849_02690 [Candidatus Taylorbacteria bacterium RIFCSPHIGHO2_01_FULL_51_15]
MLLGGHVSIAGGYKEALPRAKALGGNALQMFSGSPRGWYLPKVTPAEAEVYKNMARELGITASYFHASYLINLADDGPNGKRSVEALIAELTVASALGVRGSIIHLGSFKEGREKEYRISNIEYRKKAEIGKPKIQNLFEAKEKTENEKNQQTYTKHERYPLLISNIKAVLKRSPEDVYFVIEGMGTRKIGRSLEEIANIVKDVGDTRVRVCLDTCHLHAAGYDLSTSKKLNDFLHEFDSQIGLKRLECFHLNDSRDEFGSLRDRHENIGEGNVGKQVFKLLLNHPKLRDLAFLLEVPGFADTGPDKENMDILKSLIA